MASIIDNERVQVNAIITKYGYPETFWDIDRFVSRYYTPYDEANKDAITIKMKDGQLKQLSEVSDVVSSLSKPKYNNLLIFPATCRKEITTFIKKIEE
jgi:HD superfamily phosphohydrolase